MNRRSNRFVLKMVIGFFAAYFCSMSGFACICANGAGDGYIPPGTSSVKGVAGKMIESYVVEGAGYFLDANSYILLLLNKIETAERRGLDYGEIRAILENAAINMKEARSNYENLIKTAESTPYNQVVIQRLKDFDYSAFAEKKCLNTVIFNKVEDHLGAGDITGSFKTISAKFSGIIDMLEAMKTVASQNQIPELNDLWKLNQEASQTLLFGQYVAQVFYELRK